MKFNIKGDNWEKYKEEVIYAATQLYKDGIIDKSFFKEIMTKDVLELPSYANEKVAYYSIDKAPDICVQAIVDYIKGDNKRRKQIFEFETGYTKEVIDKVIEDWFKNRDGGLSWLNRGINRVGKMDFNTTSGTTNCNYYSGIDKSDGDDYIGFTMRWIPK